MYAFSLLINNALVDSKSSVPGKLDTFTPEGVEIVDVDSRVTVLIKKVVLLELETMEVFKLGIV